MKRFLLSALVALGVVSASAQSYLVDNPANRAYFGIRVGGEVTCPGKINGDDGDMNRVDVLWGAGVGLAYDHFYFGVSGSFGLCNMYNDSSVKFHENRVTFSLGYNF